MITIMIIIIIMKKQAKSRTRECYYVCMSAFKNLAKRYLSHWKLPNEFLSSTPGLQPIPSHAPPSMSQA